MTAKGRIGSHWPSHGAGASGVQRPFVGERTVSDRSFCDYVVVSEPTLIRGPPRHVDERRAYPGGGFFEPAYSSLWSMATIASKRSLTTKWL